MPANPASRWFSVMGFTLSFCFLCAPPAHSYEPPRTHANVADNSPVGIDENDLPVTAQTFYNDGVWCVKRGRSLNWGIKRLRQAITLSPRNADYHLALGCALAERATSLCLAELGREFADRDAYLYGMWRDRWRAAQSDPENLLYKTDLPKPPQLRIWDDGSRYEMRPTEAQMIVRSLATESLAEADQALALARSPRAKADVYFTRCWLRTLLRQSALMAKIDLIPAAIGAPAPSSGKAPTKITAARVYFLAPDPAIIRDAEAATELALKNADYWRSLGDAYVGANAIPDKMSDEDVGKAVAAYTKSLRLREDVDVWDRLLEIDEHRLKQLPVTQQVPPVLLSDMRQAAGKLVELDTGNAARYYEATYAVFLETPPSPTDADAAWIADKITVLVESGNSAAFYDPRPYTFHVPPLLQAAFDRIESAGAWYSARSRKVSATHADVSKALHSAIDVAKKQRDDALIMRRCQDLVKMAFVTCEKPTGNGYLDNGYWFDSVCSYSDVNAGYDTMIATATATITGNRHQVGALNNNKDDDISEVTVLMNALDSAYRSESWNQ